MPPARELEGQVALVSGAERPAGEAVARRLAELGAAVLLLGEGRRPSDALVEWIVDRGGLAVAHEAKAEDPGAARAAFERAEETLGPVSILVALVEAPPEPRLLPAELARPGDPPGRPALAPWLEAVGRALAPPARLAAELARRHVARGARWGRIVFVELLPEAAPPGEWGMGLLLRSTVRELARYGLHANRVQATRSAPGRPAPGGRPPGAGPPGSGARLVADTVAMLAGEAARGLVGHTLQLGPLTGPL